MKKIRFTEEQMAILREAERRPVPGGAKKARRERADDLRVGSISARWSPWTYSVCDSSSRRTAG
jgi:hypothetical protein